MPSQRSFLPGEGDTDDLAQRAAWLNAVRGSTRELTDRERHSLKGLVLLQS
jgi:hypothetical protein